MAIQQGFAKHRGRGEGREAGLRQGEVKLICWQPQNPQVYIGEREGGAPPLGFPPQGVRLPPIPSKGGGQGGRSASQVKWRPSPLGFPLSHAHGPWGGWCPWPIKARAPPYSPCYCIGRGGTISGPPESSGTFWKLPGTIPKKPELFPEPEQQLSIYKSLPPDHSGTPRDVRDLIRYSEQHSVTTYMLSL